ncbi:hypothetical protein PG995_005228 [Apiospora arundinis]
MDAQINAFVAGFTELLALPPEKNLRNWKSLLHQTTPDSTAGIFLEHGGAQAWVAFTSAKPTAAHRSGQEQRRQQFSDLDQLPIEGKKNIAKAVAAATVVDSYFITLKGLVAMERDAHKPRTMESVDSRASKRPRTDDLPPRHDSQPITPPYATVSANLETQGCQPGEAVATEEYVTGASVEGLQRLVPPYMNSAVQRFEKNGEWFAAGSMTFPNQGLNAALSSVLTFQIMDTKVEHLAEKLYNAHLEREGNRRVMYYDGNRRKASIGPQFTLETCNSDVLEEFFGIDIAEGNRASPPRRREKSEGVCLSLTQTITMSGFGQIGNGAHLSIFLDIASASRIYEKLYSKSIP